MEMNTFLPFTNWSEIVVGEEIARGGEAIIMAVRVAQVQYVARLLMGGESIEQDNIEALKVVRIHR